jgi:hypothetical protein
MRPFPNSDTSGTTLRRSRRPSGAPNSSSARSVGGGAAGALRIGIRRSGWAVTALERRPTGPIFYLPFFCPRLTSSLRTPEPRKRCESTECPSPALSGTLSPSDGEREGVRGSTLIPRAPANQSHGSGCLSLGKPKLRGGAPVPPPEASAPFSESQSHFQASCPTPFVYLVYLK